MKFEQTKINSVKRGAKKASYDKQTIYSILDASEMCYIAFSHQNKALVQPINFGRKNDKIYIHGSIKNRMTQALVNAGEVCLNVTLLDALKLTRSAFHHSVNYRSAVVFGAVKELVTDEDKLLGLKTIINHFVPDRWQNCRTPNAKELKATKVLEITITTASAKIANSSPKDNKTDLDLPYWAGTIPVKTVYGKPLKDEFMKEDSVIPDHIINFVSKKNI